MNAFGLILLMQASKHIWNINEPIKILKSQQQKQRRFANKS